MSYVDDDDPNEAATMNDDKLVDAYEHTDSEPGDPVADALIDEIEERELGI